MVNKDELVNPFIKVIWEDTPENFTQENGAIHEKSQPHTLKYLGTKQEKCLLSKYHKTTTTKFWSLKIGTRLLPVSWTPPMATK